MSVVRIFQIAKELNISHTDILSFLNKKGVDVKSHMSPVDEEVKNLIMAEFSKDKMLVDRFRKEQVRKEIHDTRLKEKQESQKKLQLLSLQDQRKLEKKEKLDDSNVKIESEKKKLNHPADRSEKRSTSKAKAIKKKLTPTKKQKLRKINLSNIRSEFSQPGSVKNEKDSKPKSTKVSKNVETKVKATLAALGTKKKKKVYKKAKSKIDETDENTEFTKTIKIPEFSSVDELSKIFHNLPFPKLETLIGLPFLSGSLSYFLFARTAAARCFFVSCLILRFDIHFGFGPSGSPSPSLSGLAHGPKTEPSVPIRFHPP